MKIVLVGNTSQVKDLSDHVDSIIQKNAFEVEIATTNDPVYIQELGITQFPAFCVEEEAIDFKDIIFEGSLPTVEEIEDLLFSLLGEVSGGCGDGCSSGGCGCSSGWCGTHEHSHEDAAGWCGSGCSCH